MYKEIEVHTRPIIKQYTNPQAYRYIGNRSLAGKFSVTIGINKGYGLIDGAKFPAHLLWIRLMKSNKDTFSNAIGFFREELERDYAFELIRTNVIDDNVIELDWKQFFCRESIKKAKQLFAKNEYSIADLPGFIPFLQDLTLVNGSVDKKRLSSLNQHPHMLEKFTENDVQLLLQGTIPARFSLLKFSTMLCLLLPVDEIEGIPKPIFIRHVVNEYAQLKDLGNQ